MALLLLTAEARAERCAGLTECLSALSSSACWPASERVRSIGLSWVSALALTKPKEELAEHAECADRTRIDDGSAFLSAGHAWTSSAA